MSRIKELTPEQEARFPEYVKRWTDIGLSTEPADRKGAEEGIRLAYKTAGLEEPRIVWCGSPMSQGIVRALLNEKGVINNVWDSVEESVRASVWESVEASVVDSVDESVRESVLKSVTDSVRDSVGASVRDGVTASVWESGYGQHDANWIAFYGYFREVCGLTKQTQPLEGIRKITESAGWWLPCKDVCFVSERHNILNRDAEGRLHSLTGPAVAYPDGWGVYAVHGVRVPADIIENPESITAERIKGEKNAEVRRVMMTMFGFDRYVKEIGASKVHADNFGTLYRIDDEAPFHVVHVLNSTPEPDGSIKPYWLGAPDVNELTGRRMKTAREAVAWTFGLHEKEYRPAIES